MPDPFSVNTTGQSDSSGVSPDFWNNLMNFGLATMSASSTPGMTLAGALGRGGQAAMENAKNTQRLRMEQQLQQQQVVGSQIGNASAYSQAAMRNNYLQGMGLPTYPLPQIPGVSSQQSQAPQPAQPAPPQAIAPGGQVPAVPASALNGQPGSGMSANPEPMSSTGPVWSGSAGYSTPSKQSEYPSSGGALPANEVGSYLMNPDKIATITSPVVARQVARAAQMAGMPVPEGLEKFGWAGQTAAETANAELPAKIKAERSGYQMIRGAGSLPSSIFDPMTGRIVAEGAQETVVPPGQPGAGSVNRTQPTVFPQNGSSQTSEPESIQINSPAVAPAPAAPQQNSNVPNNSLVKLPPNVVDAMESEGKQFTDFKNDLAEKAMAGKNANAAIEQMKTEARNYQPDAWSDYAASFREHKQALLNMLPGQSAKNALGEMNPDEKLNSYIDVNKNFGIILRETLKSTYPGRITNMDMSSTGKTLPGTETPMGAMVLSSSQLQAANDYNNAVSQYLQRWKGQNPYSTDHASFLNDVNQKFTPDAFWLPHLPPDMQKDAIAKIANTPNGKQRLQSLFAQRKFIVNNGLLPAEESAGQ